MDNNVSKIPDQIKRFAESVEIYDASEKIGELLNLNINQVGELDSEIRTVLLGINKPSDFTENISRRLEINRDAAEKITEEVNKEIFNTIRTKLQSATEPQSSQISTLERVGGFSVEPPANLPGEEESEEEANKNIESRESLVSSIESPKRSGRYPEVHTEPLADHLLNTPAAQPVQKITQKSSEGTKRTGPDSYREPIE